jgi:hypothetical protein
MPATVHNGGSMTRSKGRRNSHMDYFRMLGGYLSGANFREYPECELRLIGFLRISRRHSPTRFYLSFTKGLRPFNSEVQRRVYSFGGPGSSVLFLSQLPEFAA